MATVTSVYFDIDKFDEESGHLKECRVAKNGGGTCPHNCAAILVVIIRKMEQCCGCTPAVGMRRELEDD